MNRIPHSPKPHSCSSSAVSILDFPTELLREIFSILDFYEEVTYRDSSALPKKMTQLLILRFVCRRFRKIVNELPVWYQDEFHFLSLMNWNTTLNRRIFGFRDEARFIMALCGDKHLVMQMAKKTRRQFDSVASFDAIVKNIPTFSTNTVQLELNAYMKIVLTGHHDKFPTFPNLTHFKTKNFQFSVSFEQVLASCPHLESLEMIDTEWSKPLKERVILNSLTTLKIHTYKQPSLWPSQRSFFSSVPSYFPNLTLLSLRNYFPPLY